MSDNGLTIRITATLALLLGVDLLCVSALAALLVPWLRPLGIALVGRNGVPSPAVATWAIVAAPTFAAFVWLQFRYARRELLADVDAEPATDATHPDLLARVRRLATQANVDVPAVAVVDTPVANSFTVGIPGSATVAVSAGLLDAFADGTLDGDAFDAVLAHELAHIKNHDTAVMTLASFLPRLVSESGRRDGLRIHPVALVVVLGVLYLLSSPFIAGPVASVGSVMAFLFGIVLTVLFGGIALGLLAAVVLFLARDLSQYREFVADRSAAMTTGNPSALASALTALDGGPTRPRTDLRAAPSLRGLCFLPHGFERTPLDGAVEPTGDAAKENENPNSEAASATDDDADVTVDLSTRLHPPTDERIDRLRALAATLETGR